MKTYGGSLITAAFIISMLFLIMGCYHDSNPVDTFGDVVEKVPDFESIPGAENATIKVHKKKSDTYFMFELEDVLDNDIINSGMYEGWCALWNAPIGSDGQEYRGIKLYLTKSDPKWNTLNYLLNRIYDYYDYIPGTTWREIQIAIWELMDFVDFDVAEAGIFYDDGEPLFDQSLVDLILDDVLRNGRDYTHKEGNLFAVFADMSDNTTSNKNTQNLIIVTPDMPEGQFGATYRSFIDINNNPWLGVRLQIGGITITQSYEYQSIPQELSFRYIPHTGTTHQLITQLLGDDAGAIANATTSMSNCPAGSINVLSFTMHAGSGTTVSFYDVTFNNTNTEPPSFLVSDGETENWGIGGIDGTQEFTFDGMTSFTSDEGYPTGEIKVLIGCSD